MTTDGCNIASRFRESAARLPDKPAIVIAEASSYAVRRYTTLTFRDLDQASDIRARELERAGVRRGMRTLFMVKPGADFFALTFALFKLGAVPVMIDPGMGRGRLLECIVRARPEALVGIPLAHLARLLRPSAFYSVKHNIVVGARWFPGCHSLSRIAWQRIVQTGLGDKPSAALFPVAATGADELAAILFTTGSTGPAKGVEYTHATFWHQCDLIRETYGITEADIDLPTFPLFALFSVTLGMTAVIPLMDPTAPAAVAPRHIIHAVRDQKCTFSFGSPALWGKVSAYCVKHQESLPTLRNVLMAGAPVPPVVHERLLTHILAPGAETHTPYGATECLPATNIRGAEILADTAAATLAGQGTCVGRPVHGVRVEVIGLLDEPIETYTSELLLPANTVGEICVKGLTVTRRYFALDEATRLHKMRDGDEVWHRVGDLGYQDESGRLWFCGRKTHRVETATGRLYSVCCEAIFAAHENVRRAALVGIGELGAQIPVLIIEPIVMPQTVRAFRALQAELQERAAEVNLYALPLVRNGEKSAATLIPQIPHILFHKSFPVDIRHNAKIFREKLRAWAASIIVHAQHADDDLTVGR